MQVARKKWEGRFSPLSGVALQRPRETFEGSRGPLRPSGKSPSAILFFGFTGLDNGVHYTDFDHFELKVSYVFGSGFFQVFPHKLREFADVPDTGFE